jgi:hypothetical protein
LTVQQRIAGNHAARRNAGAVAVDGRLGRGYQLGVLAEAEIVAPGEIQAGFAVYECHAPVRIFGRTEEWIFNAEHRANLLVLLDRPVVGQGGKGLCREWARGRVAKPAQSSRYQTHDWLLPNASLAPLVTPPPGPKGRWRERSFQTLP